MRTRTLGSCRGFHLAWAAVAYDPAATKLERGRVAGEVPVHLASPAELPLSKALLPRMLQKAGHCFLRVYHKSSFVSRTGQVGSSSSSSFLVSHKTSKVCSFF